MRGNPRLASPLLPGDRPIGTVAAVAALDYILDDVGTGLTPAEVDMLVQYVAYRYERGEIEGARASLLHYMDLSAVLRIEAILHMEGA